jgi:hypothetical protein
LGHFKFLQKVADIIAGVIVTCAMPISFLTPVIKLCPEFHRFQDTGDNLSPVTIKTGI